MWIFQIAIFLAVSEQISTAPRVIQDGKSDCKNSKQRKSDKNVAIIVLGDGVNGPCSKNRNNPKWLSEKFLCLLGSTSTKPKHHKPSNDDSLAPSLIAILKKRSGGCGTTSLVYKVLLALMNDTPCSRKREKLPGRNSCVEKTNGGKRCKPNIDHPHPSLESTEEDTRNLADDSPEVTIPNNPDTSKESTETFSDLPNLTTEASATLEEVSPTIDYSYLIESIRNVFQLDEKNRQPETGLESASIVGNKDTIEEDIKPEGTQIKEKPALEVDFFTKTVSELISSIQGSIVQTEKPEAPEYVKPYPALDSPVYSVNTPESPVELPPVERPNLVLEYITKTVRDLIASVQEGIAKTEEAEIPKPVTPYPTGHIDERPTVDYISNKVLGLIASIQGSLHTTKEPETSEYVTPYPLLDSPIITVKPSEYPSRMPPDNDTKLDLGNQPLAVDSLEGNSDEGEEDLPLEQEFSRYSPAPISSEQFSNEWNGVADGDKESEPGLLDSKYDQSGETPPLKVVGSEPIEDPFTNPVTTTQQITNSDSITGPNIFDLLSKLINYIFNIWGKQPESSDAIDQSVGKDNNNNNTNENGNVISTTDTYNVTPSEETMTTMPFPIDLNGSDHIITKKTPENVSEKPIYAVFPDKESWIAYQTISKIIKNEDVKAEPNPKLCAILRLLMSKRKDIKDCDLSKEILNSESNSQLNTKPTADKTGGQTDNCGKIDSNSPTAINVDRIPNGAQFPYTAKPLRQPISAESDSSSEEEDEWDKIEVSQSVVTGADSSSEEDDYDEKNDNKVPKKSNSSVLLSSAAATPTNNDSKEDDKEEQVEGTQTFGLVPEPGRVSGSATASGDSDVTTNEKLENPKHSSSLSAAASASVDDSRHRGAASSAATSNDGGVPMETNNTNPSQNHGSASGAAASNNDDVSREIKNAKPLQNHGSASAAAASNNDDVSREIKNTKPLQNHGSASAAAVSNNDDVSREIKPLKLSQNSASASAAD